MIFSKSILPTSIVSANFSIKGFFSKLSVFVSFFMFVALTLGNAQETASIIGTITDQTGAVIPGVSVALTNTQTNVTYDATTNRLGSYFIPRVLPGPGYKIVFSHDGFQKTILTNLYLSVETTRTQNATLKAGAETQTVEVSASTETMTLNTVDASIGNNFQVEMLNDLPVQSRSNPSALFYQQPGVNGVNSSHVNNTNGGTSVTGSRDDQTSVTVDGLDVNDMATGNFGAIIGNAPVDSVQEFRGTTGGMSASASMGGGGHFDLVTKSGTNQFHGALVEYHRDTDMAANSWFNNNSGVARAPLIRNQFGGNVGGPIKRNKAFFFFNYGGSRIRQSASINREVPSAQFLAGQLAYQNTAGGLSYLSSAQVQAIDPTGIGFSPAILGLFNSRYPATPNNSNTGDGINTFGYRFNYPEPDNQDNYVGRLDYSLTANQNLFARFTITRENSIYRASEFPTDPVTSPYIDRSRAWVIGHTWTISDNKTNNVSWGQTVTDYNFPNTYNPQGNTQTTFGGAYGGSTILDDPYKSAVNAQSRVYPIPVLRDDFNWIKGRHNFQIGGIFKYINPSSNAILNYNKPVVGMGGELSSLDPAQYPSDIDSNYTSSYDAAFMTAVGHYASQSTVYNYDAKGNVMTEGSGQTHNYRYYEIEVYFNDSFKVTPQLTLNYGINWTNFTIPYDKQGLESAPSLDFEQYWADRVAQSNVGSSGNSSLPFISYDLSGKANGAPGMFNPTRRNFGPHVGFTYSPSFDPKTVFSGGIGVDYDRTVTNALIYQQSQHAYLFQNNVSASYGISGDATDTLLTDQRFAGITKPIANLAAPAITHPYTPYVDNGVPVGLSENVFNSAIDRNFKTPYSINISAGVQHEFPKGFLLKVNYAGRLGRRLMAAADASQLLDFPDTVSGQTMAQAVTALETQLRSVGSWKKVTAQPWFENIIGANNPYAGTYTATQIAAAYAGSLLKRGDFADSVQAWASSGLLPANVGMASQFSEFTYYTNKGSSNYHGLLVTLHKNAGYGLQFDLNYTFSKSIDNVSVDANTVMSAGYGFICDVARPRECRGPSDFDVRQVINGNLIFHLPFGHGSLVGTTVPNWADEVIGGWSLSALPSWRTGLPYFATANAFVAGYANNAPGVLTGNIHDLKPHIHKDSAGKVWYYADTSKAVKDYAGPTGFNIGARNNLYGGHNTNVDLGLGKYFQLPVEKSRLQFRVDAFNAFNHPVFSAPNVDITQVSAPFGQVSTTDSTARVLQVSLRLEF